MREGAGSAFGPMLQLKLVSPSFGFEIVMNKQEQHNVCAHNATKQSAKGQKGLSKAAAWRKHALAVCVLIMISFTAPA